MPASPTHVLMASTSFPADADDWRGVFIRHLSDAFARRDDLKLHLWAPPGDMHPRIEAAATDGDAAWLLKLMKRGGIAHALRSKGLAALSAPLCLLWRLRALFRRSELVDIYHINWLQNALALPGDGKPLLVSVLGTDMDLLNLPLVKTLLRRVFRQRATVVCPNAEWMVEPLQAIFSDVAKIRFVPFGIDPAWYAIERQPPSSGPARWLVVSRLTQAKLGPLFEWCAPLFEGQERELHLLGPMQEAIELPDWVRYHGPASPESLCQSWFPNAQGLITLSRHAEGRPQVMLEAMAAGLPIIASRLPAHENIVFHDETGWLCESQEDVAAALSRFEDSLENRRAGLAARAWVRQQIGTWDDCAERYSALYGALLRAQEHV